ncbi:hypothetical protein A6R68_23042, partial [Neotoma lepida]
MSGACSSYVSAEQEVVRGFSCPLPGGRGGCRLLLRLPRPQILLRRPAQLLPLRAQLHVVAQPLWSSLPSIGALVGLSTAAVVLLAFIGTVCVLCYLFISSKPHTKLDPGLSLQTTGSKMLPDHHDLNTANTMEAPGAHSPRQSYSLNSQLESNERQAVGPRCLLQDHFTATVTASNIPGSPEEASVPTHDP